MEKARLLMTCAALACGAAMWGVFLWVAVEDFIDTVRRGRGEPPEWPDGELRERAAEVQCARAVEKSLAAGGGAAYNRDPRQGNTHA